MMFIRQTSCAFSLFTLSSCTSSISSHPPFLTFSHFQTQTQGTGKVVKKKNYSGGSSGFWLLGDDRMGLGRVFLELPVLVRQGRGFSLECEVEYKR